MFQAYEFLVCLALCLSVVSTIILLYRFVHMVSNINKTIRSNISNYRLLIDFLLPESSVTKLEPSVRLLKS